MPSKNPELAKIREPIQFATELRGFPLNFTTTWGIFSPREIDEGTRLLLEYLDIAPDAHCFDLGCGYGPLGITMAKMAPQGSVIMADKDFVAVDYANQNAKNNHVPHAKAMLGNGFEQLNKEKFDVIVSNIPAKVGNEMLTLFLHDAYEHLNPGGRFYVVTINGLRQFMKRNFNEVFGNFKKHKQGKNYTVSSAQKES
ncbi:class I SAM-dependent methyltransferase [Pleionea sp. CnH1-48]|uniref:class I SAM-dependent methyltransferase n=1 Tax=Pleionea sp. CnH1-48 TaxID=2954494 RepID=UPI002096A6E1|nr:methyltransferase [Pleionea sp. CnH1-48]MCO7224832.1 methyltransferase [Pleionea sp. CnH1-48]